MMGCCCRVLTFDVGGTSPRAIQQCPSSGSHLDFRGRTRHIGCEFVLTPQFADKVLARPIEAIVE